METLTGINRSLLGVGMALILVGASNMVMLVLAVQQGSTVTRQAGIIAQQRREIEDLQYRVAMLEGKAVLGQVQAWP